MLNVQQARHLTQLIDVYTQARDNHTQALCLGSSGSMSNTRAIVTSTQELLTDYIIGLTEQS